VTKLLVADRPNDDRKGGVSVNLLLGGVLVWGFKQNVRRCSLASIRFMFLTSSWPPFQPPALPRTAGPDKAFILDSYRNPRQIDHLAGIFYDVKLSDVRLEPRCASVISASPAPT